MGTFDSWQELGQGLKTFGAYLYESWRTAGPAEHGPSHQEPCGGMLTGEEMRHGRQEKGTRGR